MNSVGVAVIIVWLKEFSRCFGFRRAKTIGLGHKTIMTDRTPLRCIAGLCARDIYSILPDQPVLDALELMDLNDVSGVYSITSEQLVVASVTLCTC